MPSLTSLRSKEVEDLVAELEKERAARKTITAEKAALEDELESLSQALFEEVRFKNIVHVRRLSILKMSLLGKQHGCN